MKIGFDREVNMKIVEFNDWLENEVTIEQLSELTEGLTNRELAELMYEAITNPKNPVHKKAREEAEDLFYHLVTAESVQVVDWDDDDGYADYMYDKMRDDLLTGDL
jgi:SpoVK/Ycf46/Vps4 family AAA+-type ATPase